MGRAVLLLVFVKFAASYSLDYDVLVKVNANESKPAVDAACSSGIGRKRSWSQSNSTSCSWCCSSSESQSSANKRPRRRRRKTKRARRSNPISIPLEGLYPAVYTPFDDKGELNVSVIPAYAEHLKKNGVDGVLVAGTSGEGPSLTQNERKALVEAWMKQSKTRGLKVVMQVGGQNLPDVLDLAAFAEKAGTDAILTLPELYFKPKSDKENVKYLKKVSEAAPTQPIMYYHHPSMSGVNIKPKEFFKEAVATIPNFKGMKCDFGTALALMSSGLLQKEHALFMTSHVTMSSNVMMGIDSSMTAITSIFPKTMVEIVRAVKSGNLQKAKLKQVELNERADAITSLGDYVIFSKIAMNLVNKINVGNARHARDAITKEQKNTLLMSLASIDAKYASHAQKSLTDC